MTNIDRNYLIVALAWLIVGTLFGFWMGATNSLQFISVHVAMLLPGFVTLAIYGFIYRLWPELKAEPAARIQYWLGVVSLPLLVVGAWMIVAGGPVVVAALASALAIAAALIMGWLFWTRTRPA